MANRKKKRYRRYNGERFHVDKIPVSEKARALLGVQPLICAYCGGKPHRVGKLTADHVVPRAQGGPSTHDNLVLACRKCNEAKADLPVEEFIKRRAMP